MKDAVCKTILINKNLKVTSARLEVLKLLHHNKILDAKSIFERVSEHADLATVYRVLDRFCKEKILTKTISLTGISLYELTLDHSHLHHVTCKRCGKISPLSFCLPTKFFKEITNMGFADIDHVMEFYAICKKCLVQKEKHFAN